MKDKRFRIILFAATAILILLAIGAESLYFSDFEYRQKTKSVNRALAEKETLTENCLVSLKNIIDKGEDIGDISKSELFSTIEQAGITILEYIDGRLVYWSDNSFDVAETYDEQLFAKPLVRIHNGWFISKHIHTGNEQIVALLRIRTDYGFENDLVRNGFTPDFRLPDQTGISFEKNASAFRVTDKNGNWLFSLVFPAVRELSWFILPPSLLWILVFLFVIVLTGSIVRKLASGGKPYLGLIAALIVLSSLYSIVLLLKKPPVFFETELFSGYLFSLNKFMPSLGHLFIISIILPVLTWFFYRYFPLVIPAATKRFVSWATLSLLLLAGVMILLLFNRVFTNLVSDSNINFEPFRVLDLSVYSFIGFISVLLLLTVPVMFLLKVISSCRHFGTTVFISSLSTAMVLFFAGIIAGHSDWLPLMLMYIILSVSMWMAATKSFGVFNITVLFSLLFGLYSLYFITDLSEKKNIENKKVLAVSYSSEHDPEAEHLLLNLWSKVSADTFLKSILIREQLQQSDIDNIRIYLHEKYFDGYWGNFNLSVVTCSNDSPLRITSDDMLVDNCFEFFSERIRKYGHRITGTGFWFLDNQGGRSYYTGQLFYDLGSGRKNGLFIELYSDVNAFQAGYSELLLDKKYQGYAKLKDYSFAKYINGNLVLRTGEFPYDKTDAQYIDKEYDYRIFNREGFKHILYKNGNITVMISEERLSTVDVIISFAYLFAFILLITNVIVITARGFDLKTFFYFNFRQKLQISFIALLLISSVAAGILVAAFSIKQYQSRHLENIKEKMSSIYIELENKLSMEANLTSDWRDASYPSLNELLISLSNVFNTDINLYATNGNLIATSRPEVFYRDLTSRKLNMEAFINLENLTKSEYIQREKIASLEYVSAYVPFYNDANQLLAYLNLPYFRMQSVLAREISNVIVAVVNFTLLLILLTMIIAVIISGRLTSPLRMLSEALASVELGKESKHLAYEGHDELSEMVKQYNMMVDELQESARKLTISEREYAWREMAKQVAHEIKNPLTPMKLNIQQLHKSWKDGIPGFERKLVSFTKNQIEYIETLSSIASAFSSFAKMPVANPVDLDLTEQIRMTLELFKNTADLSFRVNWPADKKTVIYADKEHLNGIFSNLIKNAIQSIPQGRAGLVKINLEIKGDKVIVSIEDNGSGIPEELKKNLFTPNFTTKSSGMGLGLSIVKRFAETAGGRVWFESQPDKGSIFFVELPVKYTVERI